MIYKGFGMIADELPFYKIGKAEHYTHEDGIKVDNVLNDLGYRSSTVYPCDEYFLAVGCSNTFGMFLNEETRYSNIIESETSIPVINIGIRGSSAHMNMLNLVKLKYSGYPMPKAIFCQWPEPERFTLPLKQEEEHLITITPHKKEYMQLYKHNAIRFQSKIAYDTLHAIYKDQKIIEFSMSEPSYSKFYNVKHIRLCDFAKDNLHAGPDTHKDVASYIMKEI